MRKKNSSTETIFIDIARAVMAIYQKYDELWPGGPRFVRPGNTFKIGTDSVLLSYFIKARRAKLACDLGCGGGLISVLLCLENSDLIVHGIEIDEQAVKTARLNAEANNISDRMTIFCEDLRENSLHKGEYDLVVTNPPYFPRNSGQEHSTAAPYRDERHCTLEDVCLAASRLLNWGGRFFMVHRPERLSEVFCTMSEKLIEPKRLQLVQPREASPPSLILVEGRRGGKPGLVIEPPIIMESPDGGESETIKGIYHR